MRAPSSTLACLAAALMMSCGGGMQLYSPACNEQYQSCTDACADLCNADPAGEIGQPDAVRLSTDDLGYPQCNDCVRRCQQQAETCDTRSPVQSESPFRAPPEGEPPEGSPTPAP